MLGSGQPHPGTCWGPGYWGARTPCPRSLNSKCSVWENHRGALGCHQGNGGLRRRGTFWKVLGERRVLRLEMERAEGLETKQLLKKGASGALGSEWPWL